MNTTDTHQLEYIKESAIILANKGKTFFWAKFLLNQQHATKAVRLYRFCRYVDDVGDESENSNSAKKILIQIIEELRSGNSNHPVIRDAINLFNEVQIDIDIPISLIKGIVSDLSLVRIKDESSLLVYCYQVAGTVGLMMSKILDIQDSRAYAHAIDLGIAMQITNICRDVREDAQMNRRYLPASLIGDIEPSMLINPDIKTQERIRSALMIMLGNADKYYQSGYHGLCFLPIRARLGIAIASGLYKHIGTHLRNKNYACWSFRSVIPKKIKLILTLKILSLGLITPHFYFHLKTHNSQLHRSIKKIVHSHA
jgi:phytoene synthase